MLHCYTSYYSQTYNKPSKLMNTYEDEIVDGGKCVFLAHDRRYKNQNLPQPHVALKQTKHQNVLVKR